MLLDIDLGAFAQSFEEHGPGNQLLFHDPVRVEHWRDGEMIAVYETLNDITNEGKNYLFNVMFNGATATGASGWFLGFINATGYTGVNATDTMASHGGWTEFTGYSQANRVAWGPGSSTAQSVTNASAAVFDVTANGTLEGVFVTTSNTKAGTTGTMWATALFSVAAAVVIGDQLKVSYTVSAP